MTDTEYLGKLAYEAYCGFTGFKSLVSGQPLPAWHTLRVDIQKAWLCSAEAVRDELRSRVSSCFHRGISRDEVPVGPEDSESFQRSLRDMETLK